MGKLLALVFALLAGSASAAPGFYFEGRCYATSAQAGDALALALSRVVPGYQAVTSTYHVRWTHTLACTRTAATSTSATINCSSVVNGSTSTSAAGAQTVFSQVQTGMGGFATSFGTCDQLASLTAADGVTLGWQVGGVWLSVAALLFLGVVVKRFA